MGRTEEEKKCRVCGVKEDLEHVVKECRMFEELREKHGISKEKESINIISILQRNILQDDLSKVTNWCATWLLKLNSAKCACVHFGSKNPGFEYVIGDSPVFRVDGFRDLGVFITKDLKPSTQCLRAAPQPNVFYQLLSLFSDISIFSL